MVDKSTLKRPIVPDKYKFSDSNGEHALTRLKVEKILGEDHEADPDYHQRFRAYIRSAARQIVKKSREPKISTRRTKKELERLAGKIEQCARDYDYLAHRVHGLSSAAKLVMDGYAAQVRMIASMNSTGLAKTNPETPEIRRLMKFIRETTGRPHRNEIADILNAAYSEASIDRIITPKALEAIDSET